jgi:hypothetical protein
LLLQLLLHHHIHWLIFSVRDINAADKADNLGGEGGDEEEETADCCRC